MFLIASGNKGGILMSNPKKGIFDIESLTKDIEEREKIIRSYRKTGHLDRKDAIKKIQELRINDEDVATVTSVKLAVFSVPFNQSTNDQIVTELTMQRDILQTKLIKKQMEEHQ
jgi:hypothetical protein